MQRIILVALFALVTIASCSDNPKPHNLIRGEYNQYHDFLLEQRQVDKSSIPLFKVKETATIPGNGETKITYIEVIDVKAKDTSATASIINGGLGHTFVTLRFKSQRSHGIHFLVKVYGRR